MVETAEMAGTAEMVETVEMAETAEMAEVAEKRLLQYNLCILVTSSRLSITRGPKEVIQ